MQKRSLEIKCPKCESTLLVDVVTGKILRHLEKGKEKVDEALFDETLEKRLRQYLVRGLKCGRVGPK